MDSELRSLRQTDTVYGRTAQRLAAHPRQRDGPAEVAPVSRELRLVMEQIRAGAVLVRGPTRWTNWRTDVTIRRSS